MTSEMPDSRDELRCIIDAGNGSLALSAWPGLRLAQTGAGWIDPEALIERLRDMTDRRVMCLVALCEASELPECALPLLRHAADALDLRVVHAPISDYAPPGPRFLRKWRALAPVLHQHLDAGASIALACSFGAGRSGTVAALLLYEQGWPMKDAIRTVRAGFPLAIESTSQEQWLLAHSR